MESAFIWFLHGCVLAYSWPLLRLWWHGDAQQGHEHGVPQGRSRASILASLLLPVISWVWLFPMAHDFRRQSAKLARTEELIAERDQRAADVAYWARQLHSGDPHAEMLAASLLEMWGVEAEEPPPPARPAGATEDFQRVLEEVVRNRVEEQAVPWGLVYAEPQLVLHDEAARVVRVFDGRQWIAATESEFKEWQRIDRRVRARLRMAGLDTHIRRG